MNLEDYKITKMTTNDFVLLFVGIIIGLIIGLAFN